MVRDKVKSGTRKKISFSDGKRKKPKTKKTENCILYCFKQITKELNQNGTVFCNCCCFFFFWKKRKFYMIIVLKQQYIHLRKKHQQKKILFLINFFFLNQQVLLKMLATKWTMPPKPKPLLSSKRTVVWRKRRPTSRRTLRPICKISLAVVCAWTTLRARRSCAMRSSTRTIWSQCTRCDANKTWSMATRKNAVERQQSRLFFSWLSEKKKKKYSWLDSKARQQIY